MDVLTDKHVTTRKAHMCSGCRKKYPAGTKMLFQSIADNATVYSVYCCNVCEEVMRRTFQPGDEYMEGDLHDGNPEYWEEVKAELEGKI